MASAANACGTGAAPVPACLAELKRQLKTTWMSGDEDLFSRYLENGAERFFRRLRIRPATRLLDVGCGAGQLSLIAARAGARVTGCDIATNWLDRARSRAAAEGLTIAFDEADAESLPYGDGRFDVVVSHFGAMFAPRPARVASELTRVCRPGGTIAMANWTSSGFVGQMFRCVARYTAAPGMPARFEWGDEEIVRRRFHRGIADVQCAVRVNHFDYPFPPATVVDLFRTAYGPLAQAFACLDPNAQDRLRTELVLLWSARNDCRDGGTRVDAEYLEVIATVCRAG
jgi:SAM-dependent methyltransferase